MSSTPEGSRVLLTAPPRNSSPFDVCVVGAGPVGLSLALEAADGGLRVLLLEAGDRRRGGMAHPPGEPAASVLDPQVHDRLDVTTRTGVGGTSWLWGGRCVPFEPVDLAAREHVPCSGWPLDTADVAPWEERAAAHLDIGTADFHADPVGGLDETVVRTTQRERWSRRPAVASHLGKRALGHPRIAVLPDATVTEVVVAADGRTVSGLRLRHRGAEAPVSARAYVLACGGVATTRLLLSVQRGRPRFFGGPHGALGRYYMGHLTGSIASLVLTDPRDIGDWGFGRTFDGIPTSRRFTLSEETQRNLRLLNTSFFLTNLPFSDARHGSGALSLFALLLVTPGARRLVADPETRRRNTGQFAADRRVHLRNICRQPRRTVRDLTSVARSRLSGSRRRAEFLLPTATGTYALRYHAEQAPDPDSRICLNRRTGADGLPGVDIDFRYSEQDVDSVLRAHAVLDAQLRASGLGQLDYSCPADQRAAAVRAQARDGYHQIGTTRMSRDPALGVVDADCRVHGLDALYVAGSSVFPTSGEANPTFMAVTLAVRLAHHLADHLHA
jgi:choline dehydrogenase-like flavoprotein